jgi:hypothetical protein
MKGMNVIAVSFIALAALPVPASAQQKTIKEQIVGACQSTTSRLNGIGASLHEVAGSYFAS